MAKLRAQARREGGEVGELGAGLLLVVFGAVTIAVIRALDAPSIGRLDLLLQASGLSLLVTALVWFFLLALQRGFFWSLAMLIPYVNLVAASTFARRYWSEGARAPALLAILALLIQTLASLRMLAAPLPPLV